MLDITIVWLLTKRAKETRKKIKVKLNESILTQCATLLAKSNVIAYVRVRMCFCLLIGTVHGAEQTNGAGIAVTSKKSWKRFRGLLFSAQGKKCL